MSKIGFYSIKDPRLGFLLDHGLDTADIVRRESEKSDSFHVEVSAEKPEDFADVDLIISYSLGSEAEDKKLLEGMQAHPLLSKIPAIAEGNIVFLEDGPVVLWPTPPRCRFLGASRATSPSWNPHSRTAAASRCLLPPFQLAPVHKPHRRPSSP